MIKSSSAENYFRFACECLQDIISNVSNQRKIHFLDRDVARAHAHAYASFKI